MRISVLAALLGLLNVAPVFSQSGTIKGVITDGSGAPLQGATVAVKGTNNGVVSDVNGNYQINNVNDNAAVLSVSFVGFVTKEITVGSQTVINVTMDEDEVLDEVVVVGYGTQKKASLTGSVTTLDISEIRAIPAGNLSNALAGRLSGVTVNNTSGGRPGNSSNLVIRSRGTWNGVEPLYVIDGVARDKQAFDMLTANDIENMSILKDAAAASVYGARAANGVVMVTTKRGKAGKPIINYSGSVSVGEFAYEAERETVAQRMKIVRAGQFEYRNVLGGGMSIQEDGYHPAYSSIYKNGVDESDGYINSSGDGRVFSDYATAYYSDPAHQYDRLAEVYRTPVTNNHSLGITGGSDNVKYYVGANYYNETGIFKSVDYEKYSIRSNLETKINRYLTASLALNLDNSIDNSPREQGARLENVYRFLQRSTLLAPGVINGKYISDGIGNSSPGDSYSAIANGDAGITNNQYWNAEYTASLQWEIPWIKGLTAKVLYNRYTRHRLEKAQSIPYQTYNLVIDEKDPQGMTLLPIADEASVQTRGSNYLEQYNVLSKNYQLNGIINYSNTFGKHEVGAMLAYEQTESYSEWSRSRREDYESFSRPFLNFGSGDRNKWKAEGSGSENGRISYVGRFTYAYDSRYLADFSFREDLSSNFDPAHRKGFFPSGSLAWRISEESFFKNNVSFINNLKLRGSIGLTGNDNVGAFQWLDRINSNASGFYIGGSGIAKGAQFSSIANPLITWEKSLSYNGGIDIGILNMFTIDANYFYRKTYDILGAQTATIPNTFGAEVSASNYGKVNSFGFEIELGFDKQINKDIAVWAKGNFGWADNELVEFAEPEGTKPWLSKIGKNWDRRSGPLTDGIVHQMYKLNEKDVNGQDLYRVVTSTGNTYTIPANYYRNDGSRTINNGNVYSLRPGCLFYRDLRGQDADGNPTGPDGYAEENSSFDQDWTIDHVYPPYNYGLLLGGSWKGLSLEVFLQGTAGNQKGAMVHNGANPYWNGTGWGYWTGDAFSIVDNPTGQYPVLVNPLGGGTGTNHFWIRNASFVRLKNVTISYDLPKNVLSRIGLSDARIYVTGNNLALLWTKFKFHDPELGDSGKEAAYNEYNNPSVNADANNGVATYPLMRTMTIGLSFSF
jgi:TonB-linked SusC/RagA family outer membrane protein